MSTEEKNVGLSSKDLKEIISSAVSTAIAEAKKPTVLEQQELDRQKARAEQELQTRRDSAEQIRQNMVNDAFRKNTCLHEGGKPKHSHGVFVSDDLGGYVLCQVCRAVIRPESQLANFPKDFQQTRKDVIFNTQLFNKLFQATDASGLFA